MHCLPQNLTPYLTYYPHYQLLKDLELASDPGLRLKTSRSQWV